MLTVTGLIWLVFVWVVDGLDGGVIFYAFFVILFIQFVANL